MKSTALTDGLRTKSMSILTSPGAIRDKYLPSEEKLAKVLEWRNTIKSILNGDDGRFLAVVGPCSIHNEKAAMDYFRWLKTLSEKFSSRLFIVGRSCFEKPRTRNGWEGALADWDGDGSGNLEKGVDRCRFFLSQVTDLGLPVALEALDQNSEQFFSDLLSMIWVGARTVEAMTLRRMISAMSMPVGVKNSTSGDINSAIDAMVYAATGKTFFGIDLDGRLASVSSSGNQDTFLILRGGKRPSYAKKELLNIVSVLNEAKVDQEVIRRCQEILGQDIRPNYTREEIGDVVGQLSQEGLPSRVVVDVSHGNSRKDYQKQIDVWRDVVVQRRDGNLAIRGAMLESYNKPGNQKYSDFFQGVDPDTSVTDACLGRKETEDLLNWTYEQLS